MTITIGSSHHFLFCARKAQNSLDQALALGLGGGFLELAGRVGESSRSWSSSGIEMAGRLGSLQNCLK